MPIDMYSSSCQQVSLSAEEFHQKGRENATAELASLYEYVYKMPEGPQKQHFLKKVINKCLSIVNSNLDIVFPF